MIYAIFCTTNVSIVAIDTRVLNKLRAKVRKLNKPHKEILLLTITVNII